MMENSLPRLFSQWCLENGGDSTDSKSVPNLNLQVERQRLKKAQMEAWLQIHTARVAQKVFWVEKEDALCQLWRVHADEFG